MPLLSRLLLHLLLLLLGSFGAAPAPPRTVQSLLVASPSAFDIVEATQSSRVATLDISFVLPLLPHQDSLDSMVDRIRRKRLCLDVTTSPPGSGSSSGAVRCLPLDRAAVRLHGLSLGYHALSLALYDRHTRRVIARTPRPVPFSVVLASGRQQPRQRHELRLPRVVVSVPLLVDGGRSGDAFLVFRRGNHVGHVAAAFCAGRGSHIDWSRTTEHRRVERGGGGGAAEGTEGKEGTQAVESGDGDGDGGGEAEDGDGPLLPLLLRLPLTAGPGGGVGEGGERDTGDTARASPMPSQMPSLMPTACYGMIVQSLDRRLAKERAKARTLVGWRWRPTYDDVRDEDDGRDDHDRNDHTRDDISRLGLNHAANPLKPRLPRLDPAAAAACDRVISAHQVRGGGAQEGERGGERVRETDMDGDRARETETEGRGAEGMGKGGEITAPNPIPKLIHRVWLGGGMPQKYVEFGTTWQRRHPDWTVIDWDEKKLGWVLGYSDNTTTAAGTSTEGYTGAGTEGGAGVGREAGLRLPRSCDQKDWGCTSVLRSLVCDAEGAAKGGTTGGTTGVRVLTNVRAQSDVIRYELLFRFGGLYVDTDFEAIRDLSPLITRAYQRASAYAVKATPSSASTSSTSSTVSTPLNFAFAAEESPGVINNALLGSTPRHPFFGRMLRNLAPWLALHGDPQPSSAEGGGGGDGRSSSEGSDEAGRKAEEAEDVALRTGPGFLTQCWRDFPGELHLIDRKHVSPYVENEGS